MAELTEATLAWLAELNAIIRADERAKVAEEARRFWSHVDQADTSGCWVWTAGRINGYGQFSPNRATTVRAHRWAYEQLVGPIPEGLTLDHLCRNRACVKPAHLDPVTIGENTLRGNGPSALNARKARCPQGHPYDAANTYVDKRGRRACKACRKVHQANSLARIRERAKATQTATAGRTAPPESVRTHPGHGDAQEAEG